MRLVLERVYQRAEMELSSIGDQVFAVESITKKRVRKVRSATCNILHITYITYFLVFLPGRNSMFSVPSAVLVHNKN